MKYLSTLCLLMFCNIKIILYIAIEKFNPVKKEVIMKKFYISNFYVTTSSNTIKINIDIEEASIYSIEVVNLKTNFIQTVVPEIRV